MDENKVNQELQETEDVRPDFTSNHELAKDVLKTMMDCDNSKIEIRKQIDYVSYMDAFYNRHAPGFAAYELAYSVAEDPDQYAQEMAEYLVGLEVEHLNATKKHRRKMKILEDGLYSVLYTLPAMKRHDSEPVMALAEKYAAQWAVQFGGQPLGISDAESLAAGFGGSWIRRLLGLKQK